MTTQSKKSSSGYDMAVFNIGAVLGVGVAMLSLWLWFTHQANPSSSPLADISQMMMSLIPAAVQSSLSQQAEVMGLPLTGETTAFWYMSRSSGVIAYLLLWAATAWGITMSSKIARGVIQAPLVYSFHEFLPLLALGFSLFHAFVLLGDRYINFTMLNLIVPFTSPYEPLWTGLGTVALYFMVIVTVSTYLKQYVGRKLWRGIHYLAYLSFIMALVHSMLVGSDAHAPLMLLMYITTGLSIFFLTIYRLLSLH